LHYNAFVVMMQIICETCTVATCTAVSTNANVCVCHITLGLMMGSYNYVNACIYHKPSAK